MIAIPGFFGPECWAAAPADYSWLYESNFVNTTELQLTDFQIVGAMALATNLTELDITASLTNPGGGMYSQPEALLTNVPPGFLMPSNIYDRFLFTPDIDDNEIVTATNSIAITVPGPLDTATNMLMTNLPSFGWDVSAWELPCFGSNTLQLDASLSNSTVRLIGNTYWFTNPPASFSAVSAGWLVVPAADYPTNICCLDSPPAPFEVISVATNSAGDVGLTASTNALHWLQWLCSARFKVVKTGLHLSLVPRDAYSTNANDPPATQYVLNTNGQPTAVGSGSPPFVELLNDVELTNNVKVSATLGLGAIDTDCEVRVRNFKIDHIEATLTAHPHAAFRIRADAAVTFDRVEKDLLTVNLPEGNAFALSAGPFSLGLSLYGRLYVGGQGSLSGETELTLGEQADFVAKYTVDEGKADFTPTFTPQPLDFTDPFNSTDVRGDAKVFAGVQLGANINANVVGVGVASLHGGAYLEPYVRLQVRPAQTPWWAVFAGLDGGGTVTADLLFWTPVDENFPIPFGETLLLSATNGPAKASAPGKLGAGGSGRSSGTEMRWSKIWPTLAHPSLSSSHPAPFGMALNESNNVVVGWGSSPGIWVAEFDHQGNSLWQKSYTGTAFTFGGLARVPDDGYVVACQASSPVLLRLDDAGNIRWMRSYNLGGHLTSHLQVGAFRDTNGQNGIILSGVVDTNLLAMRLDADGNVIWIKGYLAGTIGHANCVHATRDGGFLLAGYCNAPIEFCPDTNSPGCLHYGGGCVFKLDGDGNVQWASLCADNDLYDVAETPDGGALAGGYTLPGLYDPYQGASAHKFDSTGTLVWQTTYGVDLLRTDTNGPLGNSSYDETRAVIATTGGYLLGGESGYLDQTGGWLIRIGENGEPFWYTLYNGTNYDAIASVADRGDCFLALGFSKSFATGGNSSLWLSALPHSGQLVFKPETMTTSEYRYPRVDGFTGNGFLGNNLEDPWSPLSPVTYDYGGATTTAITYVVAKDYWAPSTELSQNYYEPPGGTPTLNIASAGTNATVTWGVLGTDGFVPETANAVTGPWTNAPGVVVRSNDDWLLQLPLTNSQRYFRLKR